MQYNFRHQTPDTRHQRWQLYVLNPLKNTLVRLVLLRVILSLHFLTESRLSSPHKLTLNRLSKPLLALMPLVLLSYSVNTQALSATTAKAINGTQPYLTFDNGVTKVTTTDGLLWITLSDGNTKTTYTPANNPSTAAKPIELPKENQSFADIGMLVPTNTNSIALSALIGAPYNYWGDDDGDGQGSNGITVTGNLSVNITDKNGQAVSRDTVLSLCDKAPYKVELTSTAGSLTTQYGLPNSSSFSGSTAIYYISPKAAPTICYARPNLKFASNNEPGWSGYNFAGPANIWSPIKGFLVQSTESSSYSRNFPTTGANNLYFDLDIGGVKGSALTWATVSQGGITATMTPSPDNANNIRVTLTGPVATAAQQESATSSSVTTPTLPQTFVLVGKDSSNREVLKYGFELKHWFVNRGDKIDTYPKISSWCSSLGGGYRTTTVKDLTNAVSSDVVVVGAKPSSDGNYYQRNIGAGFFTEWGNINNYIAAGFTSDYYWTSDSHDSGQFVVNPVYGVVYRNYPGSNYYGVCAYP